MKCRDCKFLSERTIFKPDDYGSVRCTLGLWDKGGIPHWYSWGESQLNRGPVKRYGDACTRGEVKSR